MTTKIVYAPIRKRWRNIIRLMNFKEWRLDIMRNEIMSVNEKGYKILKNSTHHVSKLLNFFVTTLPNSIPKRSTILWARSGWEVPEKTFMFGILECNEFLLLACFSKLSRIKLFARIGLADRTGITQSTSRCFYYSHEHDNQIRNPTITKQITKQ